MNDKIVPTITLAELYESQEQLLDALVIYQDLMKKKPSDKIQKKIDELKEKVFNDSSFEYSHLIDKIFNIEEKKRLKVLPHKQYVTFNESLKHYKNEETYPEEMMEEKTGLSEQPETQEPEPEDKTLEQPVEPEEKPEKSDTPPIQDKEEITEESIEEKKPIDQNPAEEIDPENLQQVESPETSEDIQSKPEEQLTQEKEEEIIPEETDEPEQVIETDIEEKKPEEELLQENQKPVEPAQIYEDVITEQGKQQISESESTIPDLEKKEEPEDKTLEQPVEQKEKPEEKIDPENLQQVETLETSEDIQKKLEEQLTQDKEEDEVIPEEIEEPEKTADEEPEIDKIKDVEEDIQSVKQESIPELLTNLKDFDPAKVCEILIEKYGKDVKPDEIKLSDIHFAIELLKKTDEQEDDKHK